MTSQKSTLLCALIIPLFLFACCEPVASSTRRDVAVLLRVKNTALADPDNQLGDWTDTTQNAPCNWTGITCDPNTNAVVSIDLSSLGLSGTFPADFCRIPTLRDLNLGDNNLNGTVSSISISLCSHLHLLNLSSNYFAGELPEFTPEFTNLTTLDLALNSFTGEIPASFGRFPSLQVLRLLSNYLNGSIPEFLTNLTELTRFELGYNPFNPSPLPPTIGNLKKLENLWIPLANLTGQIPNSIENLVALKNLVLYGNSLSGEIPKTIGGLKSVEQIQLYENQLSGGLPESLSKLTSLSEFDVSQNNLTGQLPDVIARMPLRSLNLNDNYFQGQVPESLALNPNLSQLKLFNNRFSGRLPVNLGLNSDLVEFDVSGNEFRGTLPPNLCYRNKLERINTFNNKFSGAIPESYGVCNSLKYIRIFNNEHSGVVPVGFWGFSGVQFFQIDHNYFQGSIPGSISNARNLTVLLVSNNNFSGSLPLEICELKELVDVDLSRNRFSGELPQCITELSNLQKLELQENMFSGEIPRSVGSWRELTELNLSVNNLGSGIPSELGKLPVLTYLDLGGNSFSGEIPVELTKLKLNKFNVSNNKLEGKVPNGFNSKFFLQSLMGNPGLCSPDLKPLPPCSRPKPVSHSIVGLLVVLGLLLIWSVFWLVKTKALNVFFTKKQPSLKITKFQRVGFSEEDLLGSLREKNLIGTGGSGQVYKVNLKSGQTVAVKRLWEGNQQGDMEAVFQSEVETLGKIRHSNVVKLLLSCIGEGFRVLVYEYMVNGSLGDVLHSEKGGSLLDWAKRYSIAVGAAQGLAYLHHDCVPAILHRDVKSNNILLDEDLRPRVADFGLAKTLQQDATEEGLMSRVAGSYGYIAPEYAYTLKVNEKSDVYSFGVLLLELVTGKRPNDNSFGENKDIVKWVTEVALSSSEGGSGVANSTCMEQLIDPRMNLSAINYEEIEKVLSVAVLCTSAFPINRPSMRMVVELLRDHKLAGQK